MKTSTVIWIIIIIILILLGIYWALHQTPYNVPNQTQTGVQTGTGGQTGTAAFAIASSSAGTYLTDPQTGKALYIYTKDSNGVSSCTGACALVWPPYTVPSSTAASLVAPSGVTGSIGIYQRSNGILQVTYNGMPLYFYVRDTGPGKTSGNKINGFQLATP